jgi:4-amino-4-deoxy-L-arabinose transferase-like glycosyltransferase
MKPDTRSFWERRYVLLAAAVLCLAAFNLTFRIDREIVTEWDESLYAITASEILQSHNWVGTTFMGALDYYNTKPPLNVWLIALAFKTLGPGLLALRIWSIAAAWCTVAVFQRWVRATQGAAVALAASLVLATTFGFMYDHAGRSGNTDALFTFLVLLTVVTLWSSQDRDWRLAWLGPIAAAVFMLRGMAVLMPLTLVMLAEWWRMRQGLRRRLWPCAVALTLFTIPVAAWLVARWRLDEWRFIARIFTYDFVARSLTVIEDHPGSPFYYLNILQRNQFDWLAAGLVALLLCTVPVRRILRTLAFWHAGDAATMLAGAWGVLALLVPTLMRTKLSWYLNPFYPPFALAVGWLFVRGVSALRPLPGQRRFATLVVVFTMALVAAESRLMWYSFNRRALSSSAQGFLLSERTVLGGQRVFRDHWTHSESFVLKGIVGAEQHEIQSVEGFLQESAEGDYLLSSNDIAHPDLQMVRTRGHHHLFRRRHRRMLRVER